MAQVNFEQLADDYYMSLYRFALSLSRKESDASDLVQQTFSAWASKGHQLRDVSKVKTWLFTTLYRQFLALRRHERRFISVDGDAELMEPMQIPPSATDAIDAAAVQEALLRLDVRFRAPVTLFYMQQHSYRQIAEILEIPIGTVMSRISRGKTELRKALLDSVVKDGRKIVSMEGVALANG